MAALSGTVVEQIRRYIPAEAMVAWATVKQLLDVLFDGAMHTQAEATIFSVVWAGAGALQTFTCTHARARNSLRSPLWARAHRLLTGMHACMYVPVAVSSRRIAC